MCPSTRRTCGSMSWIEPISFHSAKFLVPFPMISPEIIISSLILHVHRSSKVPGPHLLSFTLSMEFPNAIPSPVEGSVFPLTILVAAPLKSPVTAYSYLRPQMYRVPLLSHSFSGLPAKTALNMQLKGSLVVMVFSTCSIT